MTTVVTVLAVVLGLAVGSFLNVVVHRVPKGLSLVRPGSACPSCGSAVRPMDNVPLVSWLVLRGRCRDCRAPISTRYPLVEAGTAVLFGSVALLLQQTDRLWAVPAYLYLAAICVALALIDIDVHRLPDAIVMPAYPVAAALLGLASWQLDDWPALLRAAIGAATLWIVYFGLAVVKPGGMGFGDVKLAGVLGAYLGWLGWGSLVIGAFSAFVLGGVYAIVLLVGRRVTRSSGIPFGPWMIAGAAVGIGMGERLWQGYLGLLG